MRILVANVPRINRDTVVALLASQRPRHEVVTCAPWEIDATLPRLAPDLVICSELTTVVQTQPPAWLLFYPGGADLGVFHASGRRTILDGLTFADLLACVDGLAAASSGAEVLLTA